MKCKHFSISMLVFLLAFLVGCGTSVVSQTTVATDPPAGLFMDSYESLSELESAILQASVQKSAGSNLPAYYIRPKTPIHATVKTVHVREEYYVLIQYEEDPSGYEAVYAWFRDSSIQDKLDMLERNNISYDKFQDGDQVYYVATAPDDKGNPYDYLTFFEWEGHTMQVNLPAALGAYENTFPYLALEKVTP